MYDDYDNDGCGGLVTLLIVAAIISWITDNWRTILLVVLGIIAIIAIIIGIRSYHERAAEREAASKARAEKEAEEKLAREEASYRAYERAYAGSALLTSKLHSANEIIKKLREETDEAKRAKILAFFDRYLPVITEILEASSHGEADIDEAVNKFTDTVKAFSKSLYKVDDVVDVNSAVLENMAIRDGLYDPYAEELRLDKEDGLAKAEETI